MPILYSYRRCPYAMRARMALAAARVTYEHREVDLANKPAHLLEISPKGTVPVLQLDDQRVLEQSLDIMRYALSVQDPFGWLPITKEGEALITENDTTFKQALNAYKYPDRYPEKSQSEHRAAGEVFLQKLESTLTPHLLGNQQSMVDIAIFPFVRQFAKVDEDWFATSPYPRLRSWLEAITSTPLFEQVMTRHAVWQG